MKRHSPAHVPATVLGLAGMLGGMHPAMSQAAKPGTGPVPAQESPRSFPPDTTPYVRPVIPEDTLKTPLRTPGAADTSLPARKNPDETVPEPPTRRETEPAGPNENPPPSTGVR
jgi:hypothetical protein